MMHIMALSGAPRPSLWPSVLLLALAVFLLVLSVGLSLADTGDRTNWYMWAALAGTAVAGVAGGIMLVRARRVRRAASR